jgi:signal transduction histidine kinase
VFRRISTKLLIAVLAAVVLPFLGFAVFVDIQMAGRLSKDVVLYSLRGLAAELATKIDRDVEEFHTTVAMLAADPGCYLAIDEADKEAAGELEEEDPDDRRLLRDSQVGQFNNWVQAGRDYDLFLLVDADGRFVASSTVGRTRLGLDDEVLLALHERDYRNETWFEAVRISGRVWPVDQHVTTLLPPLHPGLDKHSENYHVGFAAPIYRPGADRDGAVESFVGALYMLVNWKRIQDEVESPVLKTYFQGLVGQDEYPSAYGWVWGADGDTILAHANRSLYGESVSTSPRILLPQMVEASRASEWGLYPEYEFFGERKNAAFKRTREPAEGGFGWTVGVGIDNDDIFRGVRELRALLFAATLAVLLVVILWTMVVARRTTAPILALREHVQRVARGDLDARVDVRNGDEVGELGRALNEMTVEIKESREKLVRAEKEAAWREMARQVAHDIKNPLTPIQLSIELCARAKAEKSPEFDAIFERTVEIVERQVAHMREIAGDFYALTGARKGSVDHVDAADMLEQVLELNRAYAQSLGVEISSSGAGGTVLADPALLRRVFLNLVSNALESMPDGGRLETSVEPADGKLRIEIRDTGVGVPDEVRRHLFEPYFTTRTKGTGLGLAISKRVLEDIGGSIELVNAERGRGTVARIVLPLAPEGGSS